MTNTQALSPAAAAFIVALARLEARKAELERLLADAAVSSAPVALHSGAAARFREQMQDLSHAMAKAAAVANSGPAEAFRQVVTRVTVHPNYELEISGNLAPLLGVQMVAGDRSERLPPESPIIPFVIKAAA